MDMGHIYESIMDTFKALSVKLTGHYRYYENYTDLQKFYRYVQIELRKSKRRRDQTNWLTWNKYLKDKSDGVSKDIIK